MRNLFRIIFFALIVCLSLARTSADTAPAITKSYNANSSVLAGMLVEPDTKTPTTVTPLLGQDLRHMLGVVVPLNDEPLVLTSATSTSQQVLVSNSGRYNVLVSNQSGAIKAGDYLTISALGGIAMKADSSQPEVVGQAAGDFNGTSNVLGSVPIKGSRGNNIKAAIGSIAVNVKLANNPFYQKSSSELPGFLSKSAAALASKHVSPVRVYLGVFIMLVTMIVTGSMFYSGIRNGVVAVGRNPLAKKAIIRSLTQVVATGLAVFCFGAVVAFLTLKL